MRTLVGRQISRLGCDCALKNFIGNHGSVFVVRLFRTFLKLCGFVRACKGLRGIVLEICKLPGQEHVCACGCVQCFIQLCICMRVENTQKKSKTQTLYMCESCWTAHPEQLHLEDLVRPAWLMPPLCMSSLPVAGRNRPIPHGGYLKDLARSLSSQVNHQHYQ